MMADEDAQFDDPELKQSIQKLWPSQPANDMTRQRVAQILRQGTAASMRQRVWPPWVAAAAVVLILAGIVGYRAYEAHEQREYIQANMAHFGEMVNLHEALAASDTSPDWRNMNALARQLGAPVAGMAGGEPTNSRILPFGSTQAACVQYLVGGAKLTVISAPADAFVEAHDGFAYDVEVREHTLSGAVRGQQLLCVIGDPGVGRQTTRRIARELQTTSP